MKILSRVCTSLVLLICFAFSVQAQIDPTFTASFLKEGSVTALERYSDGKLLVAGVFQQVGSAPSNSIFRLNVDGTVDNTFNAGTGVDGEIHDILIQDDNKIVIGGSFTTFADVSIKYLARLNADGSLDNTFNTGTGPGNTVYHVLKRMGGGLLIHGNFGTYNNQVAKNVTAINSDGTLNATFDKNAGTYLNSGSMCGLDASTLVQQASGKILYSNCGGKGIIRLNADGSLDNTFNLPSDIVMRKIKIAGLPDDKVIVGGYMDFEGASSVYKVIRLNSDGSKDAAFTIHTPANTTGDRLLIDGNGKIVFVTVVSSNFVLKRLNSTGTVDGTLSTILGPSSGRLGAIVIAPDGAIWVGGRSLVYSSQTKPLAKLTTTGTLAAITLPFIGLSATIYDVTVDAQSRILVYGDFTVVNSLPAKYLVRLLPSGARDGSFTIPITGITFNVYDQGARVNTQSDGKVLLTAQNIVVNAVGTKNGIIRLNSNGSYDATFAPTIPFAADGNSINTLLVRSDNKILLAGDFDNYVNGLSGNVALLNANGTTDNTFNATVNYRPRAALLLPDNKVMIGGLQPNDGTNSENEFGRLNRLNTDGSIDNTFVWNDYGTRNLSNLGPTQINKTSQGFFIGGDPIIGYSGNEKDMIAQLDNTGKNIKNFNSNGTTVVRVRTSLELANGLIMYGGESSEISTHPLRIIYPTGKPFGHDFIANRPVSKIVKLTESKILVFGGFSYVDKTQVASVFAINLDLIPSDKVTGLTATYVPANKARITWSYSNANASASFEIFRSVKPDQDFVKIANTSSLQYEDVKALSTKNYYKVRVVNLAGNGPFSDVVSVDLPARELPTPEITATSLPMGRLEFTWKKISSASLMEIQLTTDSTDLSNVMSFYYFASQNYPAIFPGLEENKKYFFRGRAENGNKVSHFSKFSDVTTSSLTLSAPYALTATGAGGQAILQWSDTARFSSGKYEIWKNTNGHFNLLTTVNGTGYVDDNIKADSYGYYAVRTIAASENTIIYSAYSTIASILTPSVVKGSWTAKASLPSARADAVSFAIGNYGYLGLGTNPSLLNDFYKFDPVNNSWTPINAFPGVARFDAVAFVINGKAYVGGGTTGGNNGLKDFYEYNPANNTWTGIADFPNDEAGNQGLLRGVAFAIGESGYVTMVGRTGGTNTRELWSYSPTSNTWTKKTDFPGALQQAGVGVEMDGKGYVGMGGALTLNEEWYMYDPQANTWTKKSNPSGLGSKSAVGLHYNGLVTLVAGNTSSDFFIPLYSQTTSIYTSESNSWTNFSTRTLPNLTTGRSSAAGFVIGERLYVGTGYNGSYLADFNEYKPTAAVTPGVVYELKATYVSPAEFDLSWKHSGYFVTNLEIELGENTTVFSPVATIPSSQKTFRLTGLQANKKYYARIRGKSISTNGEYVTISFFTKQLPLTPTSVAASAQSSQSIRLTWTATGAPATGYEIWRTANSSGNYFKIGTTSASSTEFIDNNGVPERTYYYKINSVNEAGFSPLSNAVNATTHAVTPPVPQNLMVTGVAATTVSLAWTNEAGATITDIEVADPSGNFFFGQETTNSIIVQNLTPKTKYVFKVRNINQGVRSAFTETIEATTLEAKPQKPYNFSGKALTDTSIELKWQFTEMADDDGVAIQRSANVTPPVFISIDTVAPALDRFVDNSVVASETYRYRIFAFSNSGTSDTTDVVSVWAKAIPAAPTQLTVNQDSVTKITLKWKDNANNEDGFIITVFNPVTGVFEVLDTLAANVTTYVHKNLSETRIYRYKVIAYNSAGAAESLIAEDMNYIVGIEESLTNGISIFPNPGKDVFSIETSSDHWLLNILDVTGKELYHNSYQAPATVLDLRSFPCGVYFFRVNVNNKTTVRKVIKTE